MNILRYVHSTNIIIFFCHGVGSMIIRPRAYDGIRFTNQLNI